MRFLLLKIGVRVNRRIMGTTIGIALCVAYLVGTACLVNGLESGAEALIKQFESHPYLVYENGSLDKSIISNDTLLYLEDKKVARCIIGRVNISGLETFICAIEDPYRLVGDVPIAEGSEIIVGSDLPINKKNVVLASNWSEKNGTVKARYSSNFFPNDWVFASKDMVWSLLPLMNGKYSFLFVEMAQDLKEKLIERGYMVVPTSSIGDFLLLSIEDIRRDLWAIVLASFIIISLLVHSIMNIEVNYRVYTIRILKYMGAPNRTVVGLFLLQAVSVSIIGAIFGAALGIISARAIASFTPLFGYPSFIIPHITPQTLLYPIIITVFAGCFGAILPALRVAKIELRGG